jgi:excisionase family DNA binding protein
MSSAALNEGNPKLPTVQETQQAKESSRLLAACVGHGKSARIKVFNGDDQPIDVPVVALRMLVDILAMMAKGDAVTVVPTHAVLTTQQAANYLNVSRPFFVGLLERKEIPYVKVGSHRRVSFTDVLAYKERTRIERERAMDELTAQAQEDGLGYQ